MNLHDARDVLEDYIDVDQPTFLWSPPGVGKSSIVKQLADSYEWGFVDYRCSTRDPVSMMGIPSTEGDTTRWKVPDEFPQVKRDGERGILFLDELNAAPPSMQAAAFGLVLDRKVGEYRLPKGWRVIGAGNRQVDRAAAQRMPSALANRFAHIDVDPDVDTTVKHFIDIDMDPMLIAFLRFRRNLLHSMEGTDLRAFPTPRSWEAVGRVMHKERNRMAKVAGLVGEGVAAEFEGFLRVYRELPSLDLVLANPTGTKVPTDPAARFAITAGLARKVTEKTFEAGMIYVQRISREFDVMFAVDAVRRDQALSHTQAFQEWALRNQDVLINTGKN